MQDQHHQLRTDQAGNVNLEANGKQVVCPLRVCLPVAIPPRFQGGQPDIQLPQIPCTSQCALFEYRQILNDSPPYIGTRKAYVTLNCSKAVYTAEIIPDSEPEGKLKKLLSEDL